MRYTSTIVFLTMIHFIITAQDLIQSIQDNLIVDVDKVEPNLIYQNIEANFSISTYSKITPFLLLGQNQQMLEQYEKIVSEAIFLDAIPEVIDQWYNTKPENVKLAIPVSRADKIQLLLSKKNITTQNFEVTTSSETDFNLEENKGVFYHGAVEGHPGSIAAVSVFHNSVRVIISDENGNYVLSLIENESQLNKKDINTYVLYNDQNLLIDQTTACLNGTSILEPSLGCTNVIPDTAPSNQFVEVFVECEHNLFSITYNSSEFETYKQVSSTFNEASIIYSLEQIEIKLSELRIINNPSDQSVTLNNLIFTASGTTDFIELLDEFANLKQDNYNGRLATLVTYAEYNGFPLPFSSGYAFDLPYECPDSEFPPLCRNYHETVGDGSQPHGPYSVLSPVSNFENFPLNSRNVYLFAHELGHNFGSPHTNWCFFGTNNNQATTDSNCGNPPVSYNGFDCSILPVLPDIDNIMGSCYTTNIPLINGFGNYPGNLMRSNYALGCGTTGTLDCHGDVSIFTDFPWLLDFVDPNNCLDEKITVWLFNGILPFAYIYDNLNGGKLVLKFFSQNPPLVLCQDSPQNIGNCIDNPPFGLNFPVAEAKWSCRCCSNAIDATNFENGWASTIWQSGGSDCRIYNNSNYALSNPNSVELRDDSGVASSMTTQSMQLQAFDNLNVSFSFIARSMEYLEDFFLELSTNGGATYTTVQRWVRDQSQISAQFQFPASVKWFDNSVRYTESIDINAFLSNNTRLRFRCDASSNWDQVYIDNVVIRGCPSGNSKTREEIPFASITKFDASNLTNVKIYPNPVLNTLYLELTDNFLDAEKIDVSIFSLEGKKVLSQKVSTSKNLKIDISQLSKDKIYFLFLKSDQKEYTTKFMKK